MKIYSFKQYRSLNGVELTVHNNSKRKPVEKPVETPTDIMFKKIFATNEDGFPTPSMNVYLSEKTSDDVRKFIEQNILVDQSQNHVITDEKVVAEFGKLKSDFIAEASRNRGESVEAYEKRLQEIISRQDADSIAASAKRLRQKFFESLKNA